MKSFKGLNLIAGVIFLALTITAAVIIYEAGVPAVQQLQATAAVDKMKTTLSDLDKVIREVATEGTGSKRTVYLSSEPGELVINGSSNTITWELETDAPIISPRTSQTFGNLVVGSNLETSVTEGTYTRISPSVPAFIVENSRLIVYINRIGSSSSHASMATNNLVLAIYNKDLSTWIENPGFMDITIDDETNSRQGTGYTEADEAGENLPFGKIKAFMDTTYIDYNIYFILESEADFITIEAEEA